jgi:plasmid maintenance system killer protein
METPGLDPEEINSDLYDEIGNLEKWQETLADMLASGNITHEDFEIEMFKTRYYIDIKTKTFILSDEDNEILQKVRDIKNKKMEEYTLGEITENEFNVSYIFYLRKEYEILKRANVEDKKDPSSVDLDIDLPLQDKLDKLQEAETKYLKSIARKHGIDVPKIPRGFTQSDIDNYYNSGNFGTNQFIDEYIRMWDTFKSKVNFYISSFEVSKIFHNPETGKSRFEFKQVPPLSDKIGEIKVSEKRGNLLTPEEQMYSDRLNNLKARLRMMTREDLLKCTSSSTTKFMSYVERLKSNKQKVFKFREHPKNYTDLREILNEENTDYYKIPSDQLFREYTYSMPNIYTEGNDMYVERGSTGYLAIKPGADIRNLSLDLSDFVTVLPMEDPMYKMLNVSEGNTTEITDVWELRGSLPGSDLKNIVKRYISFEDYLKDLKEILIENSKKSKGKTRDTLLNKIRKINYYISYGEDIEMFNTTGHTNVSKLFEDRSEIYTMRKNGLYRLIEYFTQYYPGSENLVEKIETSVFDYSSVNYDKNISKIFFLINNHQSKLEDIVLGNESIINLLSYETPYILPEDDINIAGDKAENINILLAWSPNTDKYNYYESELEEIQYNFKKFKQDNPNLNNLEIEEIIQEYSEKILWKRSLENYRNLRVPEGYIELNYKLRYLLRQRNRLPSRRVYRIATVAERMAAQNILTSTFKKCDAKDPKEYATTTENVIYQFSKSNQDYLYYNRIVNDEYKKLCSFIVSLRCGTSVESEECPRLEPSVLNSMITEFIITQGEFSSVDISRLKLFSDSFDDASFKAYIGSLRGEEINTWDKFLIEQKNLEKPVNTDYVKAIKIIKSAARQARIEKLRYISANTYVPPVVSEIKPKGDKYGIVYKKYFYISGNYIYGGNYPMFNMYDNSGNIIKENYTRSDLERLANLFHIDLVDNSFDLWKNIMEFIRNYDKKETIVEMVDYTPIDYTNYNYLKPVSKTINYTVRPRVGVKEPGYAYPVSKDQFRIYGVPYDYDENTFPVYDTNLKERVDNGFVIIEGPCIFRGDDINNAGTSDSYIILEYTDSRGKIVKTREGVSKKRIIKRKIEELDTCGRFTDQVSCDDFNSFSLDVNNLKYKCKWFETKCKGVPWLSDVIDNFDLNVTIRDYKKNKMWTEAKEKAIKYIENLSKIKELTLEEIKIISKDQKQKLYNYYSTLISNSVTKLKTITEENAENKGYLQLDPDLMDILSQKPNLVLPKEKLLDNYKTFTVYVPRVGNRKLPIGKITLNNEYTVNGKTVVPREIIDGKYMCEVLGSDEILFLLIGEFRKTSKEIITTTEPIQCFISDENYTMINNFRGYYWLNKTFDYIQKPGELIKMEKIIKVTSLHGSFIKISDQNEMLNGKPLISKENILEAMETSAFSMFEMGSDNQYICINKVNANVDAIRFSILNNVDINNLFKTVIGTINIEHVLEEIEKNTPKFEILTKEQLVEKIQIAVDVSDKETIFRYLTKAKNAGVDSELLKQALKILKSKDQPEPIPVDVPEPVPEVKPKANVNVYLNKRRR